MKKLIYLFVFLNIYTLYYAQGATLTKEETINYINKKLQECVGHKKTTSEGITLTIDSQAVRLSDAGTIERNLDRSFLINRASCADAKAFIRDSYNPAYITSVELGTNYNESESVGIIKLKLLSKTGKSTFFNESYFMVRDNGSCYDWRESNRQTSAVDEVYLYYLKGDPTNFNKIKKALEYLRDLLKAEDDPFGN